MKVNKKGLVAISGLVVASIALAGCSGSSDEATETDTETTGELTVWVDAERVDALAVPVISAV